MDYHLLQYKKAWQARSLLFATKLIESERARQITQALLLGTDVLLNSAVKARGIGARPNPTCFDRAITQNNRLFAANDHVVQKSAMLEGKLIIIPALGHQNKSSFTGSGLFVLMSQCRDNNELALQHGGFCTTWSLAAKGQLPKRRACVQPINNTTWPQWQSSLRVFRPFLAHWIPGIILCTTKLFCALGILLVHRICALKIYLGTWRIYLCNEKYICALKIYTYTEKIYSCTTKHTRVLENEIMNWISEINVLKSIFIHRNCYLCIACMGHRIWYVSSNLCLACLEPWAPRTPVQVCACKCTS